MWRGWSTTELAPAYEEHLRDVTFPALREIAGHEGAYVLRRDDGDDVEFVVVTLWASMDAVRAFAGCEEILGQMRVAHMHDTGHPRSVAPAVVDDAGERDAAEIDAVVRALA